MGHYSLRVAAEPPKLQAFQVYRKGWKRLASTVSGRSIPKPQKPNLHPELGPGCKISGRLLKVFNRLVPERARRLDYQEDLETRSTVRQVGILGGAGSILTKTY